MPPGLAPGTSTTGRHLIRAISGPFATVNGGQSRSPPEHKSGRRTDVEERSGALPKLTVRIPSRHPLRHREAVRPAGQQPRSWCGSRRRTRWRAGLLVQLVRYRRSMPPIEDDAPQPSGGHIDILIATLLDEIGASSTATSYRQATGINWTDRCSSAAYVDGAGSGSPRTDRRYRAALHAAAASARFRAPSRA
jgi:hypothetical protein